MNAAAENYLKEIAGYLLSIEKDLDHIVDAADAAAECVCSGGKLFGTADEQGFVNELKSRSGGLMGIKAVFGDEEEKEMLSEVTKGDVVFAGTQDRDAAKQNGFLSSCREKGAFVIGIGSAGSAVRENTDRFVRNPLPPGTAPVCDYKGAAICPAAPAVNIALMWILSSEFVSACLRRGKTPVLWESGCVPDGMVRNRRYWQRMFHTAEEFSLEAAAAGTKAIEYLSNLNRCFFGILSTEIGKFEETGELCRAALKAGGTVWCECIGHHMPWQRGIDGDPGIMKMVFPEQGEKDISLGESDYYIYNGYYIYPKDNLERARSSGISSSWLLGGREVHSISPFPGEIHIDAYWRYADASLYYPGYDIKVIPASGVVMTVTLWGLNAEIARGL